MKEQNGFEAGLSGLEYFSLRDYKRLLWREKWMIVFLTLLAALGTAGVTYFLPNIYRATTVILVDPRKVPDSYVMSTVTSAVSDRLMTLRQQIMSATRLGLIIDEMGLYAELRGKKPREVIIEKMRKDIEIQLVTSTTGDRGLGAFNVSFKSRHAVDAARVTNRLASLFIEENIKAREQQVLGTAEFLDVQLEQAKRDLQEKEDRIRGLRTRYVSELPESQAVHLQAMTSLQLEMRSELDAVSRAQQQKVYLQSLLSDPEPVVNLDRDGPPELANLQAQLAQLRGQLDELTQRYGPNHPDLLRKRVEVLQVEAQVEELSKNTPSIRREAPPPKRRNPVVESQIALMDEEIRKHEERQKEIKKQVAYHQSKLERIPVLEQQMASVQRDYQAAQDHYRRLLDRKFSADMSSDLEVRQKGERFVVLDPAQVPEKPYSPNRPLINLLGLAGGLGLGIVVAFARELLDPSVKTQREVTAQMGVGVFGEIPWLPTKVEQRRQLLRNIFAVMGSTALAAGYVALLYLTRD